MRMLTWRAPFPGKYSPRMMDWENDIVRRKLQTAWTGPLEVAKESNFMLILIEQFVELELKKMNL